MKQTLLLYVFGLPFGFLLFCCGFRAGLFASDPIIFYRGLKIVAVAGIVQWALLALVVKALPGSLSQAHAFAATMGSFALSVTFLIVIPVSLDRSVSVFMLGYMKNVGRPLGRPELERALEDVYIKDFGAIDRRVSEQLESGNIVVGPDGKIRLSSQGAAFVRISKLLAPTFDVNMQYLDPPVRPAKRP